MEKLGTADMRVIGKTCWETANHYGHNKTRAENNEGFMHEGEEVMCRRYVVRPLIFLHWILVHQIPRRNDWIKI